MAVRAGRRLTLAHGHSVIGLGLGVVMKLDKTLICLLAWAFLSHDSHAAPQKASFASGVSTTQWALGDFDPQLPTDWTQAEFLVVEFRSSASQHPDFRPASTSR